MASPISPTTRISYMPAQQHPVNFSLGALTETLKALRQPPTLQQLGAWLQKVEVEAAELHPYVGFKAGTYARHRVFRNEYVELLVLCWMPGQSTPIHDHNGSHGAVCVLEGVMWETSFNLNDARGLTYGSAREWTRGEVTGADVPDIHQLGNPEVSGQDLITLHMYAPPLSSLNIYRIGSTESLTTLCLDSWNPTI